MQVLFGLLCFQREELFIRQIIEVRMCLSLFKVPSVLLNTVYALNVPIYMYVFNNVYCYLRTRYGKQPHN